MWLTQPLHARFSLDSIIGVQKLHTQPTSRIGGVAILTGLVTAWLVAAPQPSRILGNMLLAAVPAFTFGLIEDLTKKVSAWARLVATMSSGVLACYLTGVTVQETGVVPLDWILSFPVFAVLFTAFAVGGVANAINIIDGFNGLAGGCVAIMLASMGVMALSVGDTALANVCFFGATATLGFCAINWPAGKLFLGDGGAYLLGFVLAWMAVILPTRHAELDAWATLLVCTYPVLEVGFSVRRRHNRRGRHPSQADNVHLHHLIHRRIVRKLFPQLSPIMQNSLTSPLPWLATAVPCAWAISFATNTPMLAFGFGLFIVAYAGLYARLSQFRWCFSAWTLNPDRGMNNSMQSAEALNLLCASADKVSMCTTCGAISDAIPPCVIYKPPSDPQISAPVASKHGNYPGQGFCASAP